MGCVWPENTHLLCKGKYNCPADLLFAGFGDSAVLLNWNYKQICLLGQILTGQTGGQPYSDISPYKVIECSLVWHMRLQTIEIFRSLCRNATFCRSCLRKMHLVWISPARGLMCVLSFNNDVIFCFVLISFLSNHLAMQWSEWWMTIFSNCASGHLTDIASVNYAAIVGRCHFRYREAREFNYLAKKLELKF